MKIQNREFTPLTTLILISSTAADELDSGKNVRILLNGHSNRIGPQFLVFSVYHLAFIFYLLIIIHLKEYLLKLNILCTTHAYSQQYYLSRHCITI